MKKVKGWKTPKDVLIEKFIKNMASRLKSYNLKK